MLNPELEDLCDTVRSAVPPPALPVNVRGIAAAEGIELAEDEYGPDFLGRIEFLPSLRTFVLYCPAESGFSPSVRIRFSMAHELGHYYLPEHRARLLIGKSHDSLSGFMSDKSMEREADEFAACLLVPRAVLDRRMGTRAFLDMGGIMGMARDLQVSLPAAAIRYAHYTEERCTVIVSQAGKAMYCVPSDGMRAMALGFLTRGSQLPAKSCALGLIAASTFRESVGRKTSTTEWFPKWPNDVELWEDSVALGYGGQAMTLLSVWRS